MSERGKRKTRDEATQAILDLMTEHPGIRFKPSYLSSNLQIGRERTAGLLQSLQDDGKVVFDGQGWLVSPVNPQKMILAKPTSNSESVQSWVVIGYVGKAPRVTIDFREAES